MRIHYLTNRATPYKNDQIKAWRTALPENALQMWYLHDNVGENLWSKDSLHGVKEGVTILQGLRRWWMFVSQLPGSVILIGGYYAWPYWLALILARIFQVPAVLVFDGCNPHHVNAKSWSHFLKWVFVRLCAAHFANGEIGRQFIRALSPRARIFDQALFVESETSKADVEASPMLESLKRKIRLIFCGRLVERKRVVDLIEAVSLISDMPMQLVIIGDGPEMEALTAQAQRLRVETLFVGAITQRSVVFEYFRQCDLLVLPSENEPWGMVVNEALLQGARVLVSDECGCAPDLKMHIDVAGVFPCRNIQALSAEIIRLLGFTDRVSSSHPVMRINNKQRSINEFCDLMNFLKPQWNIGSSFMFDVAQPIKSR